MGGRSDQRTVGLSVPLLLLASGALAQVAPNNATLYLHPTDVSDARALWVNPAGLGAFPEASVHLDLTVGDPGANGRLRQLTLGLNSRGLALGYQRDLFSSGGRGHTYRVGYAAGRAGLAAGFATVLYRGETSSTGWDLGILYDWTPAVSVGGVIQNIGRPVVRDSTLRITYVPSATLQLAGRRVVLSALSRLTSDGVAGYAFGLRGTLRAGTSLPIGLLARLDTDRSLRRGGFAFGCSLGAEDLAGLVATTPSDVHGIDALSLYGVSTRRVTSTRRSVP
ncbi:MAG TPA: hypothetical protein VEL29_04910 [Gemmatimonadales bacterium]|nr:hypothetical protein [Gemmatimonadales bacterium]